MSKKPKMVICRNCNTPIEKNVKVCPSCGIKNKKPFYKQWWFILIIIITIIIAIGMIGSAGGNKKETFEWKEIELCHKLPEPKSNIGSILINSDDSLFVNVEKTSKGDYQNYIEECQSMGYMIDAEKDGEYYRAFDEEGYELSVSYIEETMYIELTAPKETGKSDDVEDEETELKNADEEETQTELENANEEETQTELAETEPDETENSSDNTASEDDMRPEFKKAMDSYEEFMNEYCDFMEKYAESDGTDLDLLSDYADYMSKYADVVKDFEAWDNEELNAAEMAYYLDVQTRITKRLLEISQ